MRFLRGQAAIALTLAIPMIVGAACIGADMRVLYRTSARLQQATDAAVLCGAAYLPANPALAEIAARRKAQMSGIREDADQSRWWSSGRCPIASRACSVSRIAL
jgi:Flp pilus assembly protein TadG